MTRPWSEQELATLAAVAETFVRGDAVRRARLTAEALERAADPAQVAQLRLVLRLIESRLANLVLAQRPTAFRSMAPRTRERYLLGWSSSRIGLRRTAFAGLRKILTFLAYADPGVDGPNPRLAAIGYTPDRPPVAAPPDRASIVPERLPFDVGPPDEPMVLEADAIVVGSGAGGGVVADELAAAGRSVVVLEAGPYVDEAAMPTDELDAFGRLYLNHGLLATWDGAVTLLSGSGVGGGTLVNWMTSLPAPADVREAWARDHGLGGLADGEAWSDDVAHIERDLGVTETSVIPPKDQVILRGAAALGWEADTTRRNGPGCSDCGSCGFGCRRGSKASGLRVHLARAHGVGARIVPRVRVTRVLLEADRVVGVEGNALWVDPATSEPLSDPAAPGAVRIRRLVVRAPVVVVAAGALRTPAVLVASGLAHSAIGRHLRIHPVPVVAGRFATPIEMWRGPMQAARSLEFVADAPAAPRHRGYVIESAPGHPGLFALALPWEGTDEHARVMAAASRMAPLLAVTRDGGEGRVSTTRAGRVRVDYRLDRIGVATLRHALIKMSRLARAAGADEILAVGSPPAWFRGGTSAAFERYVDRLAAFDFGPNRGAVFSAHQMGTARMGATARSHACDPWGRVRVGTGDDRPVRGLYVADASLFPGPIGVNPAITVMALARRVARTVIADT